MALGKKDEPELLTAQISALVAPSMKDRIDYLADTAGTRVTQGDVIRVALAAGLPPVAAEQIQEWKAAKAEGRAYDPAVGHPAAEPAAPEVEFVQPADADAELLARAARRGY